MEGNSFSQRVVELALNIPEGQVTTYGALARAAGGGSMAARSVTSILGKYPNQRAIPYHRIVYAGGRIWLPENSQKKRLLMYENEGIKIDKKGLIKDFEEILCDFS